MRAGDVTRSSCGTRLKRVSALRGRTNVTSKHQQLSLFTAKACHQKVGQKVVPWKCMAAYATLLSY